MNVEIRKGIPKDAERIIDNLNSLYKNNQEQGPVLTKKKN